MSKFRYPGPSPFNDKERDIFFGRDKEIIRLYTRIVTNQVVILHAESGTGKSSLVNAGLLHELEENSPEYIPVIIRFEGIKKGKRKNLTVSNQNTGAMIEEIIAKIKPLVEEPETAIAYLKKNESDLWYWNKVLQKSDKAFLFIFDQFENVDNYRTEQVKEFKKALANLFGSKVPDEYYKYLHEHSPFMGEKRTDLSKEEREQYNLDSEFIRQPLDTRALFIVQDDKLSVVTRMKDYFPSILQVTEDIKLLDDISATKAIIGPATKEGDFYCPIIRFDNVIDLLKKELVDEETGLYDPLEIQIVCSYIEKKILADLESNVLVKDADNNSVTISKEYIPEIEDVIEFFYKGCWETVLPKGMSEKEFEKKRKLIISELVMGGVRVPVLKETFKGEDREIVKKLVKTRLVRIVTIGGQGYFQLCHNRFIKAVEDDLWDIEQKEGEEARMLEQMREAQEQQEKEQARLQQQIEEEREEVAAKRKKTRRLIITLSIVSALVFAVIFLYLFDLKARKFDRERIKNIMASLERSGNPTLSYLIGNKWADKKRTLSINSILDFINKQEKVYLSAIAYLKNGSDNIQFSNAETSLKFEYDDSLYNYDLQTGLTRSIDLLSDDRGYTKFKNIKGETKHLISHGYYVVITDSSFKNEHEIHTDYNYLSNDLECAENEKYIIADNSVYRIEGSSLKEIPVPVSRSLPEDKGARIPAPLKTIFLDSGRHVLVLYDDGVVKSFKIEEKKGRVSLSLVREEDPAVSLELTFEAVKPYKILATDKSRKYVFVTQDQEIKIFSADDFKQPKAKEEVFDEGLSPVTRLTGHKNVISMLAFSDDGKLFASVDEGNNVLIWDTDDLSIKGLIVNRNYNIRRIWFEEGHKVILFQTFENLVYVWRVGKAKQLYDNKQLYPFSEIDFAYWRDSLDKNELNNFYDTAGMGSRFRLTLQNLLGLQYYKAEISRYREDEEIKKKYTEKTENYFWQLWNDWNYGDQKNKTQYVSGNDMNRLATLFKEVSLFSPDAIGITDDKGLQQKWERAIEFYRRGGWQLLMMKDSMMQLEYQKELFYPFYAVISNNLDSAGDSGKAYNYLRFYRDTVIHSYFAQKEIAYSISRNISEMDILLIKYYIKTNNPEGIKNHIKEIRAYSFENNYDVLPYELLYLLAAKKYEEATNFFITYKRQLQGGIFYYYGDKFLDEIKRHSQKPDEIEKIKKMLAKREYDEFTD